MAEAPLKLKKSRTGSAGFNFWASPDDKNCVDGKNLTKYWEQILMHVRWVEECVGVLAIMFRFPSHAQLATAYVRTVKEAQELLAPTGACVSLKILRSA